MLPIQGLFRSPVTCLAVPEQAKGSSLLVEDVRHVRLQACGAEAAAATRFQRRHSPACQELMYVSNGDRNGVCHFLGRACGTQQWVNPVIAGTVTVGLPVMTGINLNGLTVRHCRHGLLFRGTRLPKRTTLADQLNCVLWHRFVPAPQPAALRTRAAWWTGASCAPTGRARGWRAACRRPGGCWTWAPRMRSCATTTRCATTPQQTSCEAGPSRQDFTNCILPVLNTDEMLSFEQSLQSLCKSVSTTCPLGHVRLLHSSASCMTVDNAADVLDVNVRRDRMI